MRDGDRSVPTIRGGDRNIPSMCRHSCNGGHVDNQSTIMKNTKHIMTILEIIGSLFMFALLAISWVIIPIAFG